MLGDRYQIKSLLGKGGWGEVNLATDNSTGQQVAIKRISPETCPNINLVENEIKALSALDHANVAGYIDSFVHDGCVHVVTEFIEGVTLEEMAARGPIKLQDIEKYTFQLLDALEHIHSRGVIHSDLKPANIIINVDNDVRLIDFGIVRTASAEIAADIKEIRGTLHYMSPEQAEGNPYDIRSDLFSCGVLLYELCTGKKPFEGDYDMAIVYAILYEEPIPPDKINADISPELSAVILKLLEKNPSERPGSATQVAEMLKGVFKVSDRAARKGGGRVAILPFEFPPEDSDSKLIAEGLRDELYTRLKQLKGLDIISPIKVAQHKNNLKSGEAIRKLLGADDYLTGSVRRIAARIRIYLMLLSTTDDSVTWTEKYDSPISDLFDIIDMITEKVMEGFKAQLVDPSERKMPVSTTTRPEAYELYLLARGYYVKNTKKDNEYARNMYLEALKIDPGYALAQVGVADCYCQEYMNYIDRSEDIVASATEWAQKALDHIPDLPEAYRALGRIMQATGNPDKAIDYYLKAVTYKEDYYLAYRSLGWVTKDSFKYDEALNWVRKSLSLNSTDLETIFLKGLIHFENKESKQAINDFTRCLELRPDYGRAFSFRGMTYYQLGRVDDAIESIRQAINFGGDINAPYLLGYYYIVKGDYERGIQALQDAAKRPEIEFLAEFYLGLAHFLLNRTDKAAKHFEKSRELCRTLIDGDPSFAVAKSFLIKDLAFLGHRQECYTLIDELRPYTTFDGSIAHDIAAAFVVMGDHKKADEYVKYAVEIPQGPTEVEISLDPIFNRILKN